MNNNHLKIYVPRIEDYAKWIGNETVERIIGKASSLTDRSVVHVNSTLYGGGVAVLLDSMTLLLNEIGRLLENYLDMFNSFETTYRLNVTS